MKSHIFEDDFPEVIHRVYREQLAPISPQEFMAAVFVVCKSNSAKSIIRQLDRFYDDLSYSILIEAFDLMKEDELSMYYFTRFLIEYCGIEPFEMMKQHPKLRNGFAYVHRALPVVSIQVSEPDEDDIDHRFLQLKEKLAKEGAPIV